MVSEHGTLLVSVAELFARVEDAFGLCPMSLMRLASGAAWSRGCGL
jgi:hypothetical protein